MATPGSSPAATRTTPSPDNAVPMEAEKVDLGELEAIFRDEASALLNELADTLAVTTEKPPTVEALSVLRRLLHNLKGAAFTVGARNIADPCHVLEAALDTACQANRLPSAIQLEDWSTEIGRLKRVVKDEPLLNLSFVTQPGPIQHQSNATANGNTERRDKCVPLRDIRFHTQSVAQTQARLSEQIRAILSHFGRVSPDSLVASLNGSSGNFGATLRSIHDEIQALGRHVDALSRAIDDCDDTDLTTAADSVKNASDPTLVLNSPAEPGNAVAAHKRVLVVDDSPIVRAVEEQILSNAGFEVTCCEDGPTALKALETGQFALVLCDIQMPLMDGFELTSRIRKSQAFAQPRVLLATGRSSPKDVAHGTEVGADAFISKDELTEERLSCVARELVG